tara:strand:+ start:1216 stop:1728 length:513 start_codon:yes stop_codon:yes gene_type:complete
MSCILANGIALGCKDSLGGIKEVYIGSTNATTVFTYDADDVITGATAAPNFFTFEQRNEQGEFVQTGQHSVENGTNFWEQSVSLIFTKNDAEDRNTLMLLAQSTLMIIVLDQNGKYWVVGESNGADLTASTQSAGKAYGDLNGTTVSFMGKESSPAREMDSVTFATLTVA